MRIGVGNYRINEFIEVVALVSKCWTFKISLNICSFKQEMNSFSRFPPYIIAAAVIFMITCYNIFTLRSKNYNLERSSTIVKEALKVSKEKNKVLVKDALEKIEKKDTRIKLLEQENYLKHTKLGEKQTKLSEMRSEMEKKNSEIKKLHKLADDHKVEIMTLSESVSKSKDVLTKLSGKAEHLMVDHKKLKKENTRLTKENEKLENDIEKEQSEKVTLDDELKKLKKENKILRIRVDDLTRKNELIQESIKQKIKESYAARRVMTHQPRQKESTEEQPTHEVTKGSMHFQNKFGRHTDSKQPKDIVKSPSGKGFSKFGRHKDSEQPTTLTSSDQESEIMANSNVSKVLIEKLDNRNVSKVGNFGSVNVSKFLVDNSDNTQANISTVMVHNDENITKTDTNSTTKSSFVRKSLNGSNIDLLRLQNEHFAGYQPNAQQEIITHERTSEHAQQGENEKENFGDGNVNRQIGRSEGKDGETTADGDDGLSENDNLKRENLNRDKEKKFEEVTRNKNVNREEGGLEESRGKDKTFEAKIENGNTNRGNEGGVREGNSDMGAERYAPPPFPKIEDEFTKNIQTLQSPKVHGEHLDGNLNTYKQDTVTSDETDT